MRNVWQLPNNSGRARLSRSLKIGTVLWAVIAVPLTLWLTLRTPPAPPVPPQRALTAVESAAVTYAAQSLLGRPVTLTSTVVSPAGRLEVTETVDLTRGVRRGSVTSMSQTAELLVVGDRVLLKGGAPFWSTLGVPTAEAGWVDVGDRIGKLPFPLFDATAALTPAPQATMDGHSDTADAATFRNGSLVAVFGDSGVTTVTFGDRTATIAPASGDALAKLASSPPPAWNTALATLTGVVGSFSVAPPPAPAPPGGAEPAPLPPVPSQ